MQSTSMMTWFLAKAREVVVDTFYSLIVDANVDVGRDDREIGGEDTSGFDGGDEVSGIETGKNKKEMEAGRGRVLGKKWVVWMCS
ncbi:LRR receptor-like serine/threonine-protein kinase [Pyrus ussuriensis x Pyrus communis]|uniref:LRR receptor-like serine/threonine-protein kinase n=1 Tax=Pyrus ussuriensis x Pyrus communis TaxID=2448454 RepID=A0A5N5HWK4_9ROSA|nr:LRR receptor-like serine/threonine-protein kinase [Pyrus ussuriensis x Pyrus communis]